MPLAIGRHDHDSNVKQNPRVFGMVNRSISFWVIVVLQLQVSSAMSSEQKWPGREEGYGPPYYTYADSSTCGDFIRAEEKRDRSVRYELYKSWIKGYISGLNASLPTGGNVLGEGNPKVEDFMLLVRTYCTNNPLDLFLNGVSASINSRDGVDWQGDRISE